MQPEAQGEKSTGCHCLAGLHSHVVAGCAGVSGKVNRISQVTFHLWAVIFSLCHPLTQILYPNQEDVIPRVC